MNQNLLKRWREIKADYVASTPERQREVLLSHARSIIDNNLGKDWQSTQRSRMSGFGNTAYAISERIKMYKIVGKEFAQAIKDDDWDNALQALNQYGTRVSYRSDMDEVLSNHFTYETFFCCEDCNNYCNNDESTSTYDGDYQVCQDCLSENYTYSHSRDTYISNSDYEDEQDEESEPEYEHIGEYHSSKHRLGHIPSSYDLRSPRVLLGLELEIEVNDSYDKDSRAGLILESISDYKIGRAHV